MNTSSPTPQKDNKSKTQFEKKKLILEKKFKENITKDIEFQAPDFVFRSSFLSFVLSGGWRMLAAIAVLSILLTISFLNWTTNIRQQWWIKPFFESDFLETDCVSLSSNVSGYLENESRLPSKDIMKLYQTDMIDMLKEEETVDHVYGFDVTYALINNVDLGTSILLGSPETYDLLDFEMSGGDCAFDGEDDMLEVVLSGEEFADIRVGDTIILTPNEEMAQYFTGSNFLAKPKEYHPLTVRVAGKVSFPYITPSTNFWVESDQPYLCGNSYSRIYMLHNAHNMEVLKNSGFCVLSENEEYYVSYKNDAAPQDIERFRSKIKNMFTMNTYNFTSSSSLESTRSLVTPETVYWAEKAPDLKYPAPVLIRLFLPPVPFILSMLGAVFMILMIHLTFNHITSGRGLKGMKVINLSDLIKTSIIIPILSAIIPLAVFFSGSLKYVGHSSTAPMLFVQFAAIIISPYVIKCMLTMIVMLLIIIIPTIFFSIKRFKSAVKSDNMTIESYTYREAEYYTEDSYTPNDFEQADYNAARNYQPSGQPDYYTADSYTPNDFDQADHSTLNADQSHPFDPTDNNY